MSKASNPTKTRSTDANRLPSTRQNGSVYAQLREELRLSVLQTGQPGDRVPSERQLAQQFGVSPITISRALQELQSEGSIERIVGKGTFISKGAVPGSEDKRSGLSSLAWDWQFPNGSSRRLSSQVPVPFMWILGSLASPPVGLLSDEFWSHRLTSHIERSVQKAGGRTVVTDLDGVAPDDIAAMVTRMEAEGVNSVVFLVDVPPSAVTNWDRHLFQLQARAGARRLSVTQVTFGNSSRLSLDTVRFDGKQGAFLATSHLLELGHRDIAFLSPSPDTPWVAERVRGFWHALQMAGQDVPDELGMADERIFCAPDGVMGLDQWELAARSAGEKLLSTNRFSAVVAANDAMAREFIVLAGESGRSVPRDLSVVGFDDRHFSSTLGLTTVHPSIEAMGEVAASLALKRLFEPFEQGHTEVVLSPTLVVRSSTRAI